MFASMPVVPIAVPVFSGIVASPSAFDVPVPAAAPFSNTSTFVPAGVSFAAARDAQFERLADLIEAHLDVDALGALIEEAAA